MSLLHTVDIQFPNELSRENSMVKQSTAVLLYKKRPLVSRTDSDSDDGVPEPLTGQYQKIGPAYFSPMKPCSLWWEGVGMGKSLGEIYTQMSTHGQ